MSDEVLSVPRQETDTTYTAENITVLKDLHVFNNTSGPHWPLFSNYLSGAQFKETLIPEGGESLDQVIARQSAELGIGVRNVGRRSRHATSV